MMIALKPQRGDIKKSHKFSTQYTKINTAINGKYSQPFELIEQIEPFEQ